MKKVILSLVLAATALNVCATNVFKSKKGWTAKEIKAKHLVQKSFCVQEGVLCSTIRHRAYTAGELFDIAMKLTSDSFAHAAQWHEPVYPVEVRGVHGSTGKTVQFSRAQMYTAVITSLEKQEPSAHDYPVSTMLDGLRNFKTLADAHPEKVAAVAEQLTVKKGVLRQDCLEVLLGLTSPTPAEVPAPAGVMDGAASAPAAAGAPKALEDASAHAAVPASESGFITGLQVTIILTGALSGILAADYLKRGSDSVLARAWAKGKLCAHNVMSCLFGS